MSAVRIYLISYNILQSVGWLWVLLRFIQGLTTEKDVWDSVESSLKIFQTLAVLEVVHAALKFVRSNPVITGVQIASRVFMVWCVLNYSPESQKSIGLPFLLFAWSITEIIRYSFYGLSLVGVEIPALVWLRYSTFLILYPLGVTGELISAYKALPKVAVERPFSLELPNRFNVAFDSYVALILIMLSYVPVFPMLFSHMISQRQKVLSTPKRKTN